MSKGNSRGALGSFRGPHRNLTWHVTNVATPQAHLTAKPTPTRLYLSSHATDLALTAAACGDAAQRERDGLIEAHRPSAVAARGVLEGGEGGQPHRSFPQLPGMPPRTLITARTHVRPGRPETAHTCRDTRTTHVDLAQRVLRRGQEWAGGENIVRARTHRRAGQPRPVPFDRPDVTAAPASILRHGTTHAVNVWTAA